MFKKSFLICIFSLSLASCSPNEIVPQSEQNSSGQDNIKDKNDASLLTGNGKPYSNLGNNGDFYINLDNCDYYFKEKGEWVLKGTIDIEIPEATTYIPAIFNNYDGTTLHTFYYEKGSTVTYNGPTPTRPSDYDGDEELPYTFIGWDKPLENIQEPTIFTAQYRGKLYNVTFNNYDGTTLYKTQVERGKDATYVGVTPSRNDGNNLKWEFIGWDKPLENIKSDTTFIAQFYASNSIKCTFLNYDGSVLSIQYIGDGDNVTYEGQIPTREDDDNGQGTRSAYKFIGWDKSLKNIRQDTEFIAQYGVSTYYEVKFVNYDNSLLYETYVLQGGYAQYEGETPTRNDDAEGNKITRYTFSEWDTGIYNITKPTIIKAVYTSVTFTGYKVTFLDNDSTELYSNYFEEGTTASYPYDNPFHYDSENVYMFVGWSDSIDNVTSETTVIAQFKLIPRNRNGEYPQSVVSDEELIASLDKLSNVNSKGYYEFEGEQYEKIRAQPRNLSTGLSVFTTFDNGSSINYATPYYFKVEPIHRKLLEDNGSSLKLVSEFLLDCCGSFCPYDYGSYGSRLREIDGRVIYGSDYVYSLVRAWLNGLDGTSYMTDNYTGIGFIDRSFNDDFFIENIPISDLNEVFFDKACLLSYSDMENENYGFIDNDSRRSRTTDYARANGAYDTPDHYGRYWTCSPYTDTYVYYVSASGGLIGGRTGGEYTSYSYGRCVRPVISLKV